MFEESPEGLGRISWPAKGGGATGLMRALGRQMELRVYSWLSHFAHGSVSAMQILDGKIDDPSGMMTSLVDATYTSYLTSTHAFLCFVWEPLVTPDGERCKKDFSEVEATYFIENT